VRQRTDHACRPRRWDGGFAAARLPQEAKAGSPLLDRIQAPATEASRRGLSFPNRPAHVILVAEMPINYARNLTGGHRTARADRHLGLALAFVAGATNAGGFLAVAQYTSHMTGIVSALADHLALGSYDLLWAGFGALASFMLGAACSSAMVNFARQRRMSSLYASPLLLEAALLLCFGVFGSRLASIKELSIPATVMLLCFIMGLQNGVISKLSKPEIRTTHITGTVTDIGIELGKALYRNAPGTPPQEWVRGNWDRLRFLTSLASCFFLGGVVGALGFRHLGYLSTVPLALVLVILAVVPAIDDAIATLVRRARR
jgi:uncharacterized membrane protein YoaK (UPF0700 family)